MTLEEILREARSLAWKDMVGFDQVIKLIVTERLIRAAWKYAYQAGADKIWKEAYDDGYEAGKRDAGVEREELRHCVRGMLAAMEMQEKRMSGDFHIIAEVARVLWTEPMDHARRLLLRGM